MKHILCALSLLLTACAIPTQPEIPPPEWNAVTDTLEREYEPFFASGTATLRGQAFLTQIGGGVVVAAGQTVQLDPATTIGNEWWGKAGHTWKWRALTPPSAAFLKARRQTVADAEGRFTFKNLPAGKYYVRTEVTWYGGYPSTLQGGLVGIPVEIADGEVREIVLCQL
jgi:hypothetical protein